MHGIDLGVVEVRDGGVVLATIRWHPSSALCPDCPAGGYWTVDGTVSHWHRAVHAFRAVVERATDQVMG